MFFHGPKAAKLKNKGLEFEKVKDVRFLKERLDGEHLVIEFFAEGIIRAFHKIN